MVRVFRFLKSLWKYILHGKRVDFFTYVHRLKLCETCEDLNNEKWTCNICGCYLDKKCKMSSETCPKHKWM